MRQRVHGVSEDRQFAVELRISLTAMFAMAALAVAMHVSLMLAGFAVGLAVAAVGEPRRVAKQLFAVTEGFFGPLFFVWLGAGLQLARRWSTTRRWSCSVSAWALGAVLAHLVAVAAAPARAVRHARQRPARRAGRRGRPSAPSSTCSGPVRERRSCSVR